MQHRSWVSIRIYPIGVYFFFSNRQYVKYASSPEGRRFLNRNSEIFRRSMSYYYVVLLTIVVYYFLSAVVVDRKLVCTGYRIPIHCDARRTGRLRMGIDRRMGTVR